MGSVTRPLIPRGQTDQRLTADSCGGSRRLVPGPEVQPGRTAFPFHPLARDRRHTSLSLSLRGGQIAGQARLAYCGRRHLLKKLRMPPRERLAERDVGPRYLRLKKSPYAAARVDVAKGRAEADLVASPYYRRNPDQDLYFPKRRAISFST
jgi:hypothetical protein